jgi:isochorismate synthase
MTPPMVARCSRLDADVDLLEVAGPEGFVFEEPHVGLAGRGVAMRVELAEGAGRLAEGAERVATALAAIPCHDEVGLAGCGPVAFGALAFSDRSPASLVVPRGTVGRAADGTRWITTVDPDGAESLPLLSQGRCATAPGPSRFTVCSSRPPTEWCEAVAAARDRIVAGELVKVVLARELVVTADVAFDPVAILRRLRAGYPTAFRFSIDGLVGASPELLVSRRGDVVRAHPMAGTAPRSADPATDARLAASLLASTKDQTEHRITIDMVLDTLLPYCSYVDAEAEPALVALANVSHLATRVEGRLSSPPASALSLAAALHPTPAVGGAPGAEALALIDELEDLDRGAYAGPVGWVDAGGNGTWAVAVRSAHIDGRRARLFGGVGVVADSDPEAELEETRSKLQAMLGALVRP